MKAIQVKQPGGPEALQLVELPDPVAGAGQVLVEVHAAGVNFIDVYHRTGHYKVDLPFTPGMEGAGVVLATGEGVTDFRPGDRVAWAMSRGAYAQKALVPANLLVKLAESVSFEAAAAAMLQGMTAHYLTHSTFPLQEGQTALVHAAAGGAGRLVVQMAKMKGARVIGTVGSEAKEKIARAAGCDEVIRYDETDFVAGVKDFSGSQGVDVVYDSVGKSTFEKGLDVLRRRGMMVLFGQSSGPVAPFDPNVLNQKGSLFVTRPSLAYYTSAPEELAWRAGDVLRWLGQGTLTLLIDRKYPLSNAGDAHRDLEGRRTAGKLLLIP